MNVTNKNIFINIREKCIVCNKNKWGAWKVVKAEIVN